MKGGANWLAGRMGGELSAANERAKSVTLTTLATRILTSTVKREVERGTEGGGRKELDAA